MLTMNRSAKSWRARESDAGQMQRRALARHLLLHLSLCLPNFSSRMPEVPP